MSEEEIIQVPEPDVLRVGLKKTGIKNLREIAIALHMDLKDLAIKMATNLETTCKFNKFNKNFVIFRGKYTKDRLQEAITAVLSLEP